MLKIAVCEDEKVFREELVRILESYFGKLEVVCLEYTDGKELLEASGKGIKWDVVFLDIEMGGIDGMQAARLLRESGIETPVIFLTSHTELAMEGYEVSAFRFLGKPFSMSKIEQTLADLKKMLSNSGRHILIRYDGEDYVLPTDEILYVEAQNNSIRIVLREKEYVIRQKLTVFEKQLEQVSDYFIRIHRGYIVNLRHIKKHHGNEVVLVNGDILPISRTMAKGFREQLFQYMRNSSW